MERKTVTIFGAGISGLTAAHELAIRGFDVRVIDPEYHDDPARPTYDRGLGGMARSQFVVRVPTSESRVLPRLWPAAEFALHDTITFDGNGAPRRPAHANDVVRRLQQTARHLRECGEPLSSMIVFLNSRTGEPDPDEQTRERWLEDNYFGCIPAGGSMPQVVYTEATRADQVSFGTTLRIYPAEHGFRFFPSFYRHLFDTMQRTPILRPHAHERTRTTVYDNLMPSEGLGFAGAPPTRSFFIPRRAIVSFEEIRKYVRLLLGELEYSLADIALFELRLFKYMTSSSERRRREYEHLSWGAFVGQSAYSAAARQHIEFGPQMSAALRGSQSDARTQGNITVQLFLDQLRTGARPDLTLDGPTSSAWLHHWHDFLVDQGVTFTRGTLADFCCTAGQIKPVLDDGSSVDSNYFILALPLTAMAEAAGKFEAACMAAGRSVPRDIRQVQRFALGDLPRGQSLPEDLERANPSGPLQHLSGIQFYFDTEARYWRGHTQYLDSEWGLTSISQPQFWARARTERDGYRSLLSVDIGIWDRAAREAPCAWECDPDEIASQAWAQIQEHHQAAFLAENGNRAVAPTPFAYALDASLDCGTTTKVNRAPFLVNRTSRYHLRPGALSDGVSQPKRVSQYEVFENRYVLAGTHMQTFTRLTSMEGANESARHAVNAILDHAGVGSDRCEIWDPEDNELPDLQWLRDLDETLAKRKLPHFMDILGLSSLPMLLGVQQHLPALLEKWTR